MEIETVMISTGAIFGAVNTESPSFRRNYTDSKPWQNKRSKNNDQQYIYKKRCKKSQMVHSNTRSTPGFDNTEKYKKRNTQKEKRTIRKANARTLSFFSLRKRTVASYSQVSFVRIYCVHRRSSGGSVLIVCVYIRRIFRLKILKFISLFKRIPK